jgi:hypothetical protein
MKPPRGIVAEVNGKKKSQGAKCKVESWKREEKVGEEKENVETRTALRLADEGRRRKEQDFTQRPERGGQIESENSSGDGARSEESQNPHTQMGVWGTRRTR